MQTPAADREALKAATLDHVVDDFSVVVDHGRIGLMARCGVGKQSRLEMIRSQIGSGSPGWRFLRSDGERRPGVDRLRNTCDGLHAC